MDQQSRDSQPEPEALRNQAKEEEKRLQSNAESRQDYKQNSSNEVQPIATEDGLTQ
jgi:hypothetical protein